MAALRFPFAAGSGALVALAVFSILWRFVNVPMDSSPSIEAERIVFTRQIVETLPDSRRDPIVQRELPPPVLPPVDIGITRNEVSDPTFVRIGFQPTVIADGFGSKVVGTDRDSVPIVRIPPEYPPRALARETEGWVKVQFSITAAGLVRDAFVVEAEPEGVFDEAALKAIARWRYNPRIANGVPVDRVGMQTVIRFDLDRL
jgi:periplasmic protein TonB